MPNSIVADETSVNSVEISAVFINAIKTPKEEIDALINAHPTASLHDLYMKSGNTTAARNATGKKKPSNN